MVIFTNAVAYRLSKGTDAYPYTSINSANPPFKTNWWYLCLCRRYRGYRGSRLQYGDSVITSMSAGDYNWMTGTMLENRTPDVSSRQLPNVLSVNVAVAAATVMYTVHRRTGSKQNDTFFK